LPSKNSYEIALKTIPFTLAVIPNRAENTASRTRESIQSEAMLCIDIPATEMLPSGCAISPEDAMLTLGTPCPAMMFYISGKSGTMSH